MTIPGVSHDPVCIECGATVMFENYMLFKWLIGVVEGRILLPRVLKDKIPTVVNLPSFHSTLCIFVATLVVLG